MLPKLILGPRPGKKSKDSIQAQGVTDILTLLSAREQPDSIEKIAHSIEAEWHYFAIDGGHIETLQNVDLSRLFRLYDQISQSQDAPMIYLHCSAGIHRTGFVTYLLLRYSSLAAADSLDHLQALRPVTAAQVGEDRIALAEAKFQAWRAA